MPPADELKVGSSSNSTAKKGGWVTFPFIIGIVGGTGLAFGGLTSNLVVYLIQEFNIKSISAAKIGNVVYGFGSVLPIAAAILVDSFLGCFSVIWISALISSLGMLVLTLTGAINRLRPSPCEIGGGSVCSGPATIQLTVLYLGLGLASLGIAGTRFTIGPMGAHQFDEPNHQQTFFNWYAFFMYTSAVISSVAIVYVQTSVSWAWGFGICCAANAVGLALFFAGNRFFRQLIPQGSPFASLARVVIAAIRKRRIVNLSQNPRDYHQVQENKALYLPSKFFRFLNHAAMVTEGDTDNPRRICTVSEVEDFKMLIKMVPIWLSAVIVTIPIVILMSFAVLQALTMDRHVGHNNFNIPAGTMGVFLSLSTCITILLIERILIPVWNRVSPQRPITLLQRVGIGHVLDVLSLAALALTEAKRLNILKMHSLQNQESSVVPMSVFWLIPALVLAGMGEAFLFPGHIAFFYQEFPTHLKSTSTAIISLSIGVAFYAGNAMIDVVRRSTDWLPDDINKGGLDNFYWLAAVLGSLNFCYFLVCAWFYKYRNVENAMDVDVPI